MEEAGLAVKKLDSRFSVCKVEDFSMVSQKAEYCFTGKTPEENSLVCQTEDVPSNTTEREDGWRGFVVEGILDFSLVGILARISSLLAKEGISIFAVSTYNTDYIFVKEENFMKAWEILLREGGMVSLGPATTLALAD